MGEACHKQGFDVFLTANGLDHCLLAAPGVDGLVSAVLGRTDVPLATGAFASVATLVISALSGPQLADLTGIELQHHPATVQSWLVQ